jgi:hypothetical protein
LPIVAQELLRSDSAKKCVFHTQIIALRPALKSKFRRVS